MSITKSEQSRAITLLDRPLPTYRQAYSDRTAWLMACLSELAYLRFNPLFSSADQKEWFLENIASLIDDGRRASLLKLIDSVAYDPEGERRMLEDSLDSLRLELSATFDRGGTQAILVSGEHFIALAFRGTEAMSIRDIKSDVRANKRACESGGQMHSGFYDAFENVRSMAEAAINDPAHADKPLYVTGHSLGGAVATVAAKKLAHPGGIAACYSFGAPRVGDDDWIAEIRSPIYRLVNSADCVTMLPPSSESVALIAWLLRLVSNAHIPFVSPATGWLASRLRTAFGGYLHCGDMRYLTNCPPGAYGQVKLLYAVGLFRRLYGFGVKKWPLRKFLKDHSIGIYRRKLMVVAERRN